MMQYDIRKDSFDIVTRSTLHLWRHDIDPPSWLTKTRSKEGKKCRPWPEAKISRKKLSYHSVEQEFLVLQLNKTFLWSGWTKHPQKKFGVKPKIQIFKQVIIRSSFSIVSPRLKPLIYSTIVTPLNFGCFCWFTIDSIVSSTIDMLKQTWFPITGRDRRIERFSSN